MEIDTNKEKVEDLLTRGTERIYPSEDFLRQRLASGERLTIYLGIDPTSPTLHVGHIVPLLKLRAFQRLGHKIILLIGDFTATIGDPTDKTATRVSLSPEQVLENARLYKEQASHIINFDGENPASLRYNSEWLTPLSFTEVLSLASKMTLAQTIKREMFQKRISEEKDLYLHEFLYPLMQGYDSVAMDVDGEVGGNDQTFNMLVGRDLMKKMKGKEKFVITMKLISDSSGIKMGKTLGNMASFSDSPEEVFGKVMSWGDNLILSGLELCTDVSLKNIDKVGKDIASGLNPRDSKMFLAREIVALYYGREQAERAEGEFIKIFQNKDTPDDILTVRAESDKKVVTVLIKNEIVKSNSEFRRLLKEGAISLNDQKINDPEASVGGGGIIKVGKRRFLKIVV